MRGQQVTLTFLSDNNPHIPGLETEWGLSVFIEHSSGNWLWDTGQSGLFIKNAKSLGLDLSNLNGVLISHGHYDHGGGLSAMRYDCNYEGPVYGHTDIQRERWHVDEQTTENIGIPGLIRNFKSLKDGAELAPTMNFYTDINRRPDNHIHTKNFFFDKEATQADPVIDDSFLLFDTPSGYVVLLGCCHSGLANSLEHIETVHGISKIHAVIGGLHLYNSAEDAVEEAATAVEKFQVEELYPCHCTGDAATQMLIRRLDCKVKAPGVGMKMIF
ncbi:MAG: MBL fold metallo-hydrolase [Desulfovibrio sp.]